MNFRDFKNILNNTPKIGGPPMIKNLQAAVLIVLTAALPAQAFARADIKLKVIAEKDAIVVVNDKKVTKRVAAKDIEPGETLIYTLHYENKGDETATNVVFDNPVPENTVYITGSAVGKDSVITFSADKGKTFKKPTQVTYEYKKPNGDIVQQKATPDKFTNIRWTVKQIDPGEKGELGFQVKVK